MSEKLARFQLSVFNETTMITGGGHRGMLPSGWKDRGGGEIVKMATRIVNHDSEYMVYIVFIKGVLCFETVCLMSILFYF